MSEIHFTGSCLCGSVQYEITGEFQRFSNCHCSRCRKVSGSGHGSNILIKPLTGITWLRGQSLLARYKVPDADRFFNCFCSKCGSPMPREIPQLDAVLAPAGSTDSELPVTPQHHIFWDSRAKWSCPAGDLDIYSEYPE